MSKLTKNQRIHALEIQVKALMDKTKLEQPKLKQLDQSVFDGQDEKWKSAAINTDGKAYLHNEKKDMVYFNHNSYGWCSKDYDRHEMQLIGDNFDPSGFAVGFIERESAELTGSDLCRAMLARGDKYVMCAISDESDDDAMALIVVDHAMSADGRWFDCFDGRLWKYAVPINNQDEPLTAKEVGL